MYRPIKVTVDQSALLHNLSKIQHYAPGKKIVAMVKANAYGCGMSKIVPFLEGKVHAFGIASLDEALAIRRIGSQTPCILFEGVFGPAEYPVISEHRFACVVHQHHQLKWLLNNPVPQPIKIWIKVNTGMNRLGFSPDEVHEVISALNGCSWVDKELSLMTHFANADEPQRDENAQQLALFHQMDDLSVFERSMANSSAIMALFDAHTDLIRPGIMLYGVSPFADKTAYDLGLVPVMRFSSAIIAIHHLPPFAQVGYGGGWQSDKPSVIAIVAAGYGDGYPRHIAADTPVWVNGKEATIVGRVSMDMLAINLTHHTEVQIGDEVELWGQHILVERIAKAAGTISYELLCQVTARAHNNEQ